MYQQASKQRNEIMRMHVTLLVVDIEQNERDLLVFYLHSLVIANVNEIIKWYTFNKKQTGQNFQMTFV